MPRPPALLLLASLAATAPSPAIAAPAAANPAAFREIPCVELDLPTLGEGTTCGRLQVPESRATTTGTGTGTLSLPVVVLHATGARTAADALLYLHGGPGFATLESAPGFAAARSLSRLRQTRDLVMFDQRGTGQVTPAICPVFDDALNQLAKDAPPAKAGTRRKIEAATACMRNLRESGRDPRAYTSTAIAEDAEDLRKALGYAQWNLLPTSYGTLPAVELARRHPGSVRSILVNSAFPPTSPNRAEQFSTTAEGLAALQARCNDDPACAAMQPDMHGELGAVIGRLNQAPLAIDGARIDGSTFLRATWTLLVRGKTAPFVPAFIEAASAGDEATVRKVAAPFSRPDSFGSYSHAQAWLVSCHDIYPRPSAALVRRAMGAHPALAQDVDPDEQDAVCDIMQPTHAPASFHAATPLDTPTLVFAGEYDPATPDSDAGAMMALVPGGTRVDVSGASHAPMGTDECTMGVALAFLESPRRPPDTACLQQRPAPAFPGKADFEAFVGSLP